MAEVPGWYTQFVGAVVASLPRDLDEATASRWANNPQALEQSLRDALASAGVSAALKHDKQKEGWTLEEDVEAPAKIAGAELEMVAIVSDDEGYLLGDEMVDRARGLEDKLGQRHAEYLLENQGEIPEAFRKCSLVFPGTIWLGRDGNHHVPCLVWRQGQWELQFGILEAGVEASDVMVRVRS